MDVVDPAQVRGEALDANALLEGDDVAVGDGLDRVLAALRILGGSGEAAGSSCEQGKALETDHFDRW